MKIGGLDIGTTGCKLTVFDKNGAQIGKSYRDYPVRRETSGHELDVSELLESVYAVIEEMTAQVFPLNPHSGRSYPIEFITPLAMLSISA